MSVPLKYPRLFTPLKIGPLELKNRIIMPSMAVALCSEEGLVTDRLLDYFTARARGGVGMAIAGYAGVDYKHARTGPK